MYTYTVSFKLRTMANKEKAAPASTSFTKEENEIKIVKETFTVVDSNSVDAPKATPKKNRGLFLFF